MSTKNLIPSDLVAGLVTLLGLVVVWRLDTLTGHYLGFSLFYLAPVLFAGGRFGLAAGYGTAVLAAVA